MNQPPPKPWTRGSHPTHTVFHLEIRIGQDKQNHLWSTHDFQTPEDRELSLTLPSGGVEQIAHGLLTEALRRQIYCVVLLMMSKDPGFLTRWNEADEKQRMEITSEVANAAFLVIHRTSAKIAAGTVHEIVNMVSSSPH